MKTACFIYSDLKRYDKLQECAINSFQTFHPNIDIYTHKSNDEIYGIKKFNKAYRKYLFAYETALKKNIEKIIILGADTITCSRLDEFIDIDKVDILTTLDHPYLLCIAGVPVQEVIKGNAKTVNHVILSNSNEDHVNADVVCFNNIEALRDTINCSFWMSNEYGEQAALNYICHRQNKYKNYTVDGEYNNSNVVYNARAKGNMVSPTEDKPWHKYTSLFQVKNNKLYTNIHENCQKSKQIKVWHYCDGFGAVSEIEFEKKVNKWIDQGFNQETKDFFTNVCNCGNFFKEKFTI